MNIDVNGIYDRLMEAHQIYSLKHLSIELGYSPNWGTNNKKRGAVPYDAIAKTSDELGISMDYLVFGHVDPADETEDQKMFRKQDKLIDIIIPIFKDDDTMPDLDEKQVYKLVTLLAKQLDF